jgi:hypothetical protein
MLGHVFYNMRRTRKEIFFRLPDFIFLGLSLPVLTTAPLIALAIHSWRRSLPSPAAFGSVFGIAILLSAAFSIFRARDIKQVDKIMQPNHRT